MTIRTWISNGEVGLHATPIVAGNVVIVGAAHRDGSAPRSKTNVKGYVRGFDAHTGKRLWIFHTIPSPGELGHETWEKDSWSYTGDTERKWHYQFVHHGIWDMNISSPPILADVTVNGRAIKVVAQATKQAWLYVFDRVTGQPVWPIEERPVPKGVLARRFHRFYPGTQGRAVKLVALHRLGPIFTPPSLSKAEGPLGTLMPSI
jgi:quinoprotein glucose dehydrogenase